MPALGGYFAFLDSYTVHEEVRFDPGVYLVTHDQRIEPMKVEVQDSREGVYPDYASNQRTERRAPWFRTTTLNAGYGSAMISAPNKTDFSSRKGTYARITSFERVSVTNAYMLVGPDEQRRGRGYYLHP